MNSAAMSRKVRLTALTAGKSGSKGFLTGAFTATSGLTGMRCLATMACPSLERRKSTNAFATCSWAAPFSTATGQGKRSVPFR